MSLIPDALAALGLTAGQQQALTFLIESAVNNALENQNQHTQQPNPGVPVADDVDMSGAQLSSVPSNLEPSGSDVSTPRQASYIPLPVSPTPSVSHNPMISLPQRPLQAHTPAQDVGTSKRAAVDAFSDDDGDAGPPRVRVRDSRGKARPKRNSQVHRLLKAERPPNTDCLKVFILFLVFKFSLLT
jgi:hypothetical protein